MSSKYVGKRIQRNEDPRLLTGQALFVDDVNIPGMLHAAFLRSDYAHARLKSIDATAARNRPGVVAIYTAEDMGEDWKPGPLLVSPPPNAEEILFNVRTQLPLVKDKVRHAGEAIAVVIAESRYIAEDAVEEIIVDLEPLAAVTDLEKALLPGTVLIHDDLGSNLAAQMVQVKGDYSKCREEADLVIKRRIIIDRGAAAAMENRGIVADWDAEKPAPDGLGYHSSSHPDPQRFGLKTWPIRASGKGDRAVRRWRVWSKNNVLPGGDGHSLGCS